VFNHLEVVLQVAERVQGGRRRQDDLQRERVVVLDVGAGESVSVEGDDRPEEVVGQGELDRGHIREK